MRYLLVLFFILLASTANATPPTPVGFQSAPGVTTAVSSSTPLPIAVYDSGNNSGYCYISNGNASPATFQTCPGGSGSSLSSGKIFVGNASNQAAAVFPSGDVSMDNTGKFDVLTNNNGTAFGTACAANTGTSGGNVPLLSSNNLQFSGTGDSFSAPVSIGTTTATTGVSLDLGSVSNSLLLPVGTTGQRPGTGVNGMIRYNSTTNAAEGYINGAWTSLLPQLNAPSLVIGGTSLNGSELYINVNQTSNPVLGLGGTSAADVYGIGFIAGRGMLGYDNTDTIGGTSGNMLFNSGNGHGIAFKVNSSANNTWNNGTLSFDLDGTGLVKLPNIGSDATHTDATVCEDTTSHALYSGSGTAGICLGTSSARYKNDIRPLSAGLDQIEKLKPVIYRYKKGYGDGGNRDLYGFLAEDVQTVLPQLVSYDKNGLPNTVDYVGVIPVLVRAIQEQQYEIDYLNAQIAADANKKPIPVSDNWLQRLIKKVFNL